MADAILPEGLRFFPKHEKAPDFVLGTMIITPNDLNAWIQMNPGLLTEYQGKKQVKLQLLKSQAGKLYAKVDTWKPEQGNNEGIPVHSSLHTTNGGPGVIPDEPKDDLPF